MATFRDLKTFLEHDGWQEEPNLARGRVRRGDHLRYRKELADGTILRTKVSHALRDEIGADLFRHILRDQLRVTEEQFWAVVRRKQLDATTAPVPSEATIPGWLVQRLLFTVGLAEGVVRSMTPDEAHAAWEACSPARRRARPTVRAWTQPRASCRAMPRWTTGRG